MKKSQRELITLLLGLFLVVTGCCRSQRCTVKNAPNEIDRPKEPITVNLEKYFRSLKQATVEIQGEKYSFLFDTGGGWTIIGQTKLAETIGCFGLGRTTGHRSNGEQVNVQNCRATKLQLGSFQTEVEPGYLDLTKFIPKELPPIDGVISLHTFMNQAITLDWAGDHLIVESEKSLRARTRDMQEMRISVDRIIGGRGLDIFVEAKTPTGPIWLLFDTGNISSFTLAKHTIGQLGLNENQITAESRNDAIELELEITGLGNVLTRVSFEDLIRDGLIDAKFIEQFVFTIDLKTNRMWGKTRD